MTCYTNCRICDKLIVSSSVTVVGATLVIDIPTPTSSYFNGNNYCIVVAQPIPDAATVNMPVAVSIGGVTTTLYPLINANCTQVTASAINTRVRYKVRVVTSATGGSFKLLSPVRCATNNLAGLPVTATTT